MFTSELSFGRKDQFFIKDDKEIMKAVRKSLAAGGNYFKKEAQKSFEAEMGHYPHKVKKHVNNYAKLIAGVRGKIHRGIFGAKGWTYKVSIMAHPLLHLFESGAGDGHYKKTRSYKDTRSKSGKHKLGRPRKYASNTLFGSKTLGDGTKVRVTTKGVSRGRIEATHFFKKVKESPSIMNEITRRIDTTFHNEMNKILKRLGQ